MERQRVLADNRASSADREIAAMKTELARYKSVRECVAGELQRCNTAQLESLNMVETRLALDRVLNRLDAAHSGHNWRPTKPEFTTVRVRLYCRLRLTLRRFSSRWRS